MDRGPPPRRGRPPAVPAPRGRRRGLASRAPPSPPIGAPASAGATAPRPHKSRNRRRGAAAPPPPPPPTVAVKLIVRRLPPTITAADFFETADAHGADAAVWRSFFPGSSSASGAVKRLRTVVRHGVAYLGFATQVAAESFFTSFNGFRFEEPAPSAGGPRAEYFARVERAMWQGVPPLGTTRRRGAPPPPPVQPGTIESDPDYLAFVARFEADAAASTPISLPQPAALLPAPDPGSSEKHMKASRGRAGVITPLMEDVRARRKERDLKKKAPKPGMRAQRVKGGRPVVVAEPATRPVQNASSTPPSKSVSAASRRKKSRRSGGAEPAGNAIGKKMNESSSASQKKGSSAKPPLNGRRTAPGEGKPVNGVVNGSVNANLKGTNNYHASTAGESNGVGENGKVSTLRPTSGRSRSARAARARARAAAAGGTAFPSDGSSQSREGAQGALRLLRKEASNGHKT